MIYKALVMDMNNSNKGQNHTNKIFVILKKVLGATLIVYGILALFTPFTPGAWLIFIGAELIGWRFVIKGELGKWLSKFRLSGENHDANIASVPKPNKKIDNPS